MVKALFLICTLTWRVNNYVSGRGNGINRRNKSPIFNLILLENIFHFDYQLTVQIVTSYSFKNTSFRYSPKLIKRIQIIQSSLLLSVFPFKKMAALGKKRKLTAVLRETQEEHLMSIQSRNTSIPILMRNTSRRFPRRLKGGSFKNCPKNSAGRIPASWELCLN